MNEFKNSETSIEALSLGKVYWDGTKELQVFNEVSLKVASGEGVAILGPSGSGKTTLLNILSGLDFPSQGEARLCGMPVSGLSENERADFRNKYVGFVFQFYQLLPEFTALENVMLPALISKEKRKQEEARNRAEQLLKRVGLSARSTHFPSELSGGEQQRVAIARALMNDPAILFCDEPTGNLDSHTRQEISELLESLYRKEKKTVLMVTHDQRLAQMADKVWDIEHKDWVAYSSNGKWEIK